MRWTEEERQGFAQAIEEEADHLNHLVGNLLDISRIEGGSLKPQMSWHDLGSLIDDVVERLRPVTRGHRLRVTVPDDLPAVWLDPVEIGQVLYNLVENAAKYSPPDTEIAIEVRRAGGVVRVQVSGPRAGIPLAAMPHLFEPFYRVIDGKPRPQGLGLGLAIVKGLVEAHGGQVLGRESGRRWRAVHVHAAFEQGGSRSPARARPGGARDRARRGRACWSWTTSRRSCAPCRQTWAAMTFRSMTAGTGDEALEAFGRVHPDLILLDLGLPDMDGLDVIRAIRKRASTPIVVLSAREAEHDKVAALDLGADDYLTKPFGINELLARVRVALRHAAGPATGTEPVITLGEIEVNLEKRRLVANGVEVHLTPTEWDLVKLFTAHPDKVLTDRMIMAAVWGATYQAQAHSLHVYVGRLRKKLEAAPARSGTC